MLLGIGQPFRQEPPAAGAVADVASHRPNVLGKEPAGINSILFPSDASLSHDIPVGGATQPFYLGDMTTATTRRSVYLNAR